MAGFLGTISGQVRLDTRQAVAAYAALRAQNARTVYAMRGTGESFTRTGQLMVGAGGLMVYAFGKAVMAAAEFERKMDFFAAVTDTNSAKMQKLSKFTLQLAQDTIYSADQIAEGFIELGKAGVSAEQIMGGIGEAMANLGAAGDIPLAQSGQIITSTIQQFDLAAQDAVKVTDLLAGAANASIADIEDIGVSLKYVGGVANAAGLTFEDTATAISLLAKAGIRGSTAGTSLRQMIVSLGGATGPAQEALEDLGIITKDGTNLFFTAEGKAKSLSQVFQILQRHTADLTQKERLMALRTIFNNRALSAASILTREGSKGFRQMNKEMAKTTAADVAAKRLDNLSGDIEILRGNIETLMIQAGGPFQETFRGWVQTLTRLVQKFGELDPATQQVIVKAFALTGVALILMGAFNLLLGTTFLFISNLLKMFAALRLVFSIVGLLIRAVIALGVALVGAIGVTGAIVLGVLLLLVGAFILAYKKSETFRNFVNRLAKDFVTGARQIHNGIKAVLKAFVDLAKNPGKIWDGIIKGLTIAGEAIQDFAGMIGGWIMTGLSAVGGAIGGVISSIVGWFASLPGKVIGVVTSFVNRVQELLTFRNLGYAIGFVIGFIVRQFLQFGQRILAASVASWNAVIGFFKSMGVRIGQFVAQMVVRAVGAFNRFREAAPRIAGMIVLRIIQFFRSLPGRVAAFFVRMVARARSLLSQFASSAQQKAAEARDGLVNAIKSMPGKVAGFFITMLAKARAQLRRLATAALNAGYDIYNKISEGISNLPGLLSGIVGRMISAFKDKIRDAFNAAKDFSKGLWEGFKDGIGMHSPSHLERAMWQITGVLDEETKHVARTTANIQKMGDKLARTHLGVGGIDPAINTLENLAKQQRIRVSSSMTTAGEASASGLSLKQQAASSKESRVTGTLDLTANSKALLYGMAEDVDEDADNFDDTIDRMNR